MNIWILFTAVLLCAYIPHYVSAAHHRKLGKRQAVRRLQARPGFRVVRTRVRPSSSTTPPPDDYYYYEVPEENETPVPTPPPPPPPRFRNAARTRVRPQQHRQPATPIPPPPSYEEELAHYGYSFAVPKPVTKASTTMTTTTTTTPVPTEPPRTLSPGYKPRADGRIIDFRADPNYPRELKGADLTDYPFYEQVPEDINFDCSKWGDGFFASIPHRCQLFHYCYGGIRYDFLCPNYTLYDQTTFTCRFINTVECEKSQLHYDRNEALYKETTTMPPRTAPPPPPRKKPARKKPTTTPKPQAEDEYEYEYDDEEPTTTTTTTTQRPKRRRLRPRLRQRPGGSEPGSKK